MMKKASRPKPKPDSSGPQHTEITLDLTEILDQVEYRYSNHARLSSNKWDIRIAFGDIGPLGKVNPVAGVVLPHLTAKALLGALSRMVESAEKRMGRPIKDPDEDTSEIHNDAEAK